VTARPGPAPVREGAPAAGRERSMIEPRTAPAGGRLGRLVPPEVAVSWLAARLVVLASLAIVHFIVSSVRDHDRVVLPTAGLSGWDAGWYGSIAEHGYGGAGIASLRFFPLFPLLGRAAAAATGSRAHAAAALVVLANVAALAFAAALARLARREGFDDAAVTRTVWLAALAPPAFVLVMGYAEALFGLLAVGVLLGARTRRWDVAAGAGLLAGLCRPVGVLLVAAVAVEAARELRVTGPRERALRAAAVAAPALGAGAYLLWVGATYGDVWKPIRLQRQAALHGGSADPARVLWDAAIGTMHGHVGTGLHVPWLLLSAAGLVVMARTLPASYTVWSALTVGAVVSGSNLDSAERYIYGAFPFLLVGASLTRRRDTWWFVLVASTALLALYAVLAFLRLYVP
jgi:hypothetical protein